MNEPPAEPFDRQAKTVGPNQENSAADYQAWYDFAPVGFFTVDDKVTILDVNLTGASLLGVERETLTHQHLSQFIEKSDQNNFRAYCRRLSETGRYLSIELRLLRQSETLFDARIEGQIVQNKGEPGQHYRLVVSDISEQVQAKQALQESEELHRITLSSISDAVFMTDDEGKFTYICPNIAVIFGYSTQEVWQFGHISRLLGEKIFEPQALAESGELANIEQEIEDKFGRRRVVLINVKRVTIKEGTRLYTCHEITERQQAEKALRQSEEFVRGVLNSLTAHIAVLNNRGDIIAVNQAWRQFARANGASFATEVGVGINYLDLCRRVQGPNLDDAQTALAGIETVLVGTRPEFSMEYPCHSPTEKRWFLMKVTPLSGPQSSGSVVAHENITGRVLAETEKAELFEAVSRQREQLRVLTGQLAEAQEAERKALARELHDQVGQNLTALNLNLHYIRSQLNQISPEKLDQIRSRLDDSLLLVQQTTERTQDIMGELRPPVLDDYGLLSTLRWYSDQFATRVDFVIAVQGEEPVPRLAATVEHALFRITQEALTNTVKHAHASRVDIRLETDEEFTRLVIIDNGQGFDLTQWAESPSRQNWGLLTMVERAEAVGGYCQIESQLGEGTRIIVEVPR
ncbi:MAG TPA: PAS domain S-box protein [Anaerolineae bacterium]|nr:PAS domain S-box protein [Anaerolineae bacterium]